jgi:hypothetical protein
MRKLLSVELVIEASKKYPMSAGPQMTLHKSNQPYGAQRDGSDGSDHKQPPLSMRRTSVNP